MWHSVCEVGRGLLRFKTRAWFNDFMNTIVKITIVFFALVTALQATEYGSLRISNTLANPDAAATPADVSNPVANEQAVANAQLASPATDPADADQTQAKVVLSESVLLSGDAPIADAVEISVIAPVEPLPAVMTQVEKEVSANSTAITVKQTPVLQAVEEQVEQVEPVIVEQSPTQESLQNQEPVMPVSTEQKPAAKTTSEQIPSSQNKLAHTKAEQVTADNALAEKAIAEQTIDEKAIAEQAIAAQAAANQEPAVTSAKQPVPASAGFEKQHSTDADPVTAQTTLNQPSGKFKFNIVTDNMIDSLNSIIPQYAAPNEMSLETFHLMIAAAVAQHPEMRAVVEQTKVAGFVSSEAFGAYLPQVTASVDAGTRTSRSSTSSDLLPKGEGVDAAMSVKQLLYDFGATSANYDSAKYKEQASLERMATKRSEISFRTISAYIELLRARLLYKLAQENYNSRLSILNMVKERYELGGGNKVDVIRAEARLTDASATKISAGISLQMAEAGYKEMFLTEPAETPLPQDVSIALANQSIDELSKKYGAVRETELGLKSLRSDAKAASAKMLPTLNFEVNGARRSQETYYGEYSETSAHLVMRYNLFTGGSDSARKEQAMHRAEQMQQDLDNLILQVKKSIVQSTTQVNEAEGLVRVRREGVLGASQSLLAVKEHFTYRRGTLLDLLRSQEELYIAGRDYISSLMDRSISRYRLLHLTAALETMIPDLKSQ
jgi:adhesin transport system outer membrane protein